ncbi:MAG: hypothetical protein KKA07_01795 [Bacteroidetes bacterium]|nr:hypothetical protein [Bacteroidota bacterium]
MRSLAKSRAFYATTSIPAFLLKEKGDWLPERDATAEKSFYSGYVICSGKPHPRAGHERPEKQ